MQILALNFPNFLIKNYHLNLDLIIINEIIISKHFLNILNSIRFFLFRFHLNIMSIFLNKEGFQHISKYLKSFLLFPKFLSFKFNSINSNLVN